MFLVAGDALLQSAVEAGWLSIVYKASKEKQFVVGLSTKMRMVVDIEKIPYIKAGLLVTSWEAIMLRRPLKGLMIHEQILLVYLVVDLN